MDGAIFYSTRYGSTAQYAEWIAEATGLPVFNIKDKNADPSKYDFLVLGSPVIYHKLYIQKWVKKNLSIFGDKPIIFYSVSGAGPGKKLDSWMAKSFPTDFINRINHIALLGRQNPKELNLYDRVMLIIGSMLNPDPKASKEERKGFEFMDQSSITPIVEQIKQLLAKEVTA